MGMSMAPGTEVLPLTCLMLLLLCRAPGAGAQGDQDLKLQQPQDKVSVKAGETLTLNCTVSESSVPGPVKWLKGWGPENRTIYGNVLCALPRVTRAVEESNTDFTIHIRDAQPEDVGTYYCVKFRKTIHGGDEVFRHGSGTEVCVHGGNLSSSLLLLWLGMLLEKGILGGLLFFLFKRTKREALETLPCPAPCQSPIPQGGSQGSATTSRVV